MERHERGFEEEFRSFNTERLRNEEAGFNDEVKVRAAVLIAGGEDAHYIASLLEIDTAVVIGWYRTIILNNQDLTLGDEELSFYREMNVLKTDARTKGCIVKAIIEGRITTSNAQAIVGLESEKQIKNWVQKYSMDYEVMMTLPPGSEFNPRPTYVYGLAHKNELQELIFRHDRQENALAATRRAEYLEQRRT